ncbi:MAG: ABC transporter permease [Oscillospiraceae bacterium]|nr:ABC transporter permease [Oscillospiraceae bacterium]
MAIVTVLWEKWVEFRRDWVQITLSSLISPLLYILTFGLGLGQTMAVDGRAYLDFLLPGVVALTTMNSSFNAIGMSLNVQRLYEHSFDNIMISPTPLWQYILGQMTAGALRGMYAGCLVIAVGLCFGANMTLRPMFFAVMLLNGMTFASLGVLAAVLSKTHAGISRFSSFVLTPMSFLGNTFFSAEAMPKQLNAAIQCLPLTQSATLLRAISWGEPWQLWRLAVIAGCNSVFLLTAIHQINRMKNI